MLRKQFTPNHSPLLFCYCDQGLRGVLSAVGFQIAILPPNNYSGPRLKVDFTGTVHPDKSMCKVSTYLEMNSPPFGSPEFEPLLPPFSIPFLSHQIRVIRVFFP